MEKQRWEESEKKKIRRKKIQVREKVEKSRFTVVPEGPKAHKRSKIAHRCSGKQISKSKWSKHLMLGPLSAHGSGAKHVSKSKY